MSKSSTATDADPNFRQLPPMHPGEMLRVPLGRITAPQDVANAALFFASSEAESSPAS